jgi:signal transduction histidine kinase
MRWRIRSQLLVPLLLLLLAAVGISTWTGLASARAARRQTEDRLRQVAGFLNEDKSYPLTENILAQVKRLSGADFVLIRADGPALSTLDEMPDRLPERVEAGREPHLGPPVTLGGRTYLASGLRLHGRPNVGDTLYILYPQSLWHDALWEAVWPSVVLGGSLGLGAFVLAVGLGQRLSRRIRALERHTRLIADGDFRPLPEPGGDDEIRDLARSVNEMAQRLARLQQEARQNERLRLLGQVSAGLAHQMRNGLTGARLAVQLYLREAEGSADTTPLEVALRQLALLEANLKRFLALGREGEPASGAREPLSLGAILDEAVELLRPQCRHAGTALCWKPPAPLSVLGEAGLLREMFLNVLGNAVEAAGPGGEVEVCAGSEGGKEVYVDVFDTGPGPPAEIADNLFELFVTAKREGIGLGLAVARQAAQALGGSIRWDRVGERTRFRITLPAEEARITAGSEA